jgi:HlyD family secretion protein
MPVEILHDRSDEVQELLGQSPSWIIRWGTSTVLTVIMILFGMSWVIEYPDVVPSKITLVSRNPSEAVIAKASGKLAHIFVSSGDRVVKGTALGVIENPVEWNDFIRLKRFLQDLQPLLDASVHNLPVSPRLPGGQFQLELSELHQALEAYRLTISLDYHTQKIDAITRQLEIIENLAAGLEKQKDLLLQEKQIAEKNLSTGKSLQERGLISDIEFHTYQSAFLQKSGQLENAINNLMNQKLQASEYRKNILDLRNQQEELRRQQGTGIRDACARLLNAMNVWEERYVLKSSIAGRIGQVKIWSVNQWVRSDDEVFTVTPDSQEVAGKIVMGSEGIGKINVGQAVRVRFDGYPYREYGLIEGRVKSISEVAINGQYTIDVAFPGGLVTTHRRNLEFREGMSGSADIITDTRKLIQRLFENLRALFES